jgi:hypothetical protein
VAQVYPVSKYLPIWNKLKADKHVSVALPPPFHRRLIKAVIKRKDEDLAHKFLLSEAGKKQYLSYEIKDSVIHFKLSTYYLNGLGEL